MAYKYKDIEIKVGKSWTDDNGFIHPYNWADTWTSDDLTKWGVSIVEDADTSYDYKFYWSKGVERSLTDINVVDDAGKAIIDPETGKQMVQIGLKSKWIDMIKKEAKSLLEGTDWYVVRKTDIGEAIPSDVDTYRKAVRTAAASIETKINECSDLAAFKALFDVPKDSDNKATGPAPINDWPDKVS